jgi:toxin HigB-1
MAIKSFRNKGLEELYVTGRSSKVGNRYHSRIIDILDILSATAALKDLNGVNNFHPLKGSREGTYSMHVNGNWCLTFQFEDEDVYVLDFEDYH